MSLLLAFWIKIPIMPSLPFLRLDISDAPILIATMLSGYSSGISILFTVSILRCMFFSSAGFMGLIVRLTSVFLVLSVYCLRKPNINITYRVLMSVLCVLICICVKLPINYLGWIYIYGMPKKIITNLMLPCILPFNALKITLNYLLAIILFKPFKKLFARVFRTVI